MTRTSLSQFTSAPLSILFLLASGCAQREPVLKQLDRELRGLALALAPAIVELQTQPDSGAPVIVGSALAIGNDGQLLTTASVLKSGKPLLARLPGGKRAPVALLGTDWETNLALLKLEGERISHTIPLVGPSDIAIGQLGFLAGTAPMMHGPAVMFGTMAHTTLGGDDPYNYPLYALNTVSLLARPGAPVFDASGALLGMVDGKMHDAATGNWTVIPLPTIRVILPMLERGGGVPRGFLGILPASGCDEVNGDGIVVGEVLAGSPANAMGLQRGDIVSEINSVRTTRLVTLRKNVTAKPDGAVTIRLLRRNRIITVSGTLGSHVTTANDELKQTLRKL